MTIIKLFSTGRYLPVGRLDEEELNERYFLFASNGIEIPTYGSITSHTGDELDDGPTIFVFKNAVIRDEALALLRRENLIK